MISSLLICNKFKFIRTKTKINVKEKEKEKDSNNKMVDMFLGPSRVLPGRLSVKLDKN